MSVPRRAPRPALLSGTRASPGEESAGSGSQLPLDADATPDASAGARSRTGGRKPGGRPRGTPWDRALGLLAVRERSRRQVELRLLRGGFEREEVERTLERLIEAGLLDDQRFATGLAAHHRGRGAASRAVRSRLAAAGVSRDTAERAVAAGEGDDEARALEVAKARARSLQRLEPSVAHRRLVAFLQRRGYDGGVARAAASRAMGGDIPDD